jgi:hypothetical protein
MNIFNHFKHLNLTDDQAKAINSLESFLQSSSQVFMLKGFAGSGKTTILKGFVDYLKEIDKKFVFMAPTGRAANVIQEKTGFEALTIHKSIFSFDDMLEIEDGDSFFYYYKIRENLAVFDKIFIVDEASMLSDAINESGFFRCGTSRLLSDLITYTRVSNPNAKTKIIFVGDPCQLPPIGENSSKTFDAQYLIDKFNISSESIEMKEVKRQNQDSAISKTASLLRKNMSIGVFNYFNLRPNGKDIIKLNKESFLDTWYQTPNPKIIIASKNKTCLHLNNQTRNKIWGKPNMPIQKGDIMIMGGNNYRKGVYNGEFAIVNEVGDSETRTILLKDKPPVKLTWVDIELVFNDAGQTKKTVKGKMLENFLYGDNTLKQEEMQALYVDFTKRHIGLKPKSEAYKEAILSDEYFYCLLIKYGYAITCHKGQGGEWKNVFTIWDNDNTKEFNYIEDEQRISGKKNDSFYRWAYTAITRASQRLYAINPPCFNSYTDITIVQDSANKSLSNLDGNQNNYEQIEIDSELLEQLKKINLYEHPIQIQDQFISIRHLVRKQFVEITNFEKIGYEIRLTFKREDKIAVFRTYINGKFEFKNKYVVMPNLSLDNDFNEYISGLINSPFNFSIIRNNIETIQSKIEFDIELEEKFPFLISLYEDLTELFKNTTITIQEVEHLQYKERYHFSKNNHKIVVDIEYKLSGFFGRIIPIQSASNNQSLLNEIQQLLIQLKTQEYAI